jgi:hypothetical protein
VDQVRSSTVLRPEATSGAHGERRTMVRMPPILQARRRELNLFIKNNIPRIQAVCGRSADSGTATPIAGDSANLIRPLH